jgi:hypothetical protein
VSVVLEGLRKLTCRLLGHRNVLNFERDRLSLRCIDCDHRSVGWALGNSSEDARGPDGVTFAHREHRRDIRTDLTVRRLP